MSAIGTKRTWASALHMSAFDPKRTSAATATHVAGSLHRVATSLGSARSANGRPARDAKRRPGPARRLWKSDRRSYRHLRVQDRPQFSLRDDLLGML